MMKVNQAVYYHLEYHKANSQPNTQRCVEYVLGKFYDQFQERVLTSVSQEDVLSFLTKLTFSRRQTTKRNRYSVLHSFYNFTINTSLPDLKNPCSNSVIKKIFKKPHPIQAKILDKDKIDEIIFRTTNARNRLMLELMARAGMRISEVLNLTPGDIEERKLILQKPKSGIRGEVVYVPSKLQRRLHDYIRDNVTAPDERVFPISYSTSWSMVKSTFVYTIVTKRQSYLFRVKIIPDSLLCSLKKTVRIRVRYHNRQGSGRTMPSPTPISETISKCRRSKVSSPAWADGALPNTRHNEDQGAATFNVLNIYLKPICRLLQTIERVKGQLEPGSKSY